MFAGVGFLGCVIVLLADFFVTSVFKIPVLGLDLARHCLFSVALSWCMTQSRQTFMGLVISLQRYKILTAGTLISQSMTTLAGLAALFLGGTLLDLVRAQAMVTVLAGLSWMLVARRLFPTLALYLALTNRHSARPLVSASGRCSAMWVGYSLSNPSAGFWEFCYQLPPLASTT
jgi:hypothetical protein